MYDSIVVTWIAIVDTCVAVMTFKMLQARQKQRIKAAVSRLLRKVGVGV
jgi:hypothetical protein